MYVYVCVDTCAHAYIYTYICIYMHIKSTYQQTMIRSRCQIYISEQAIEKEKYYISIIILINKMAKKYKKQLY